MPSSLLEDMDRTVVEWAFLEGVADKLHRWSCAAASNPVECAKLPTGKDESANMRADQKEEDECKRVGVESQPGCCWSIASGVGVVVVVVVAVGPSSLIPGGCCTFLLPVDAQLYVGRVGGAPRLLLLLLLLMWWWWSDADRVARMRS